jgi:hypothetical protein
MTQLEFDKWYGSHKSMDHVRYDNLDAGYEIRYADGNVYKCERTLKAVHQPVPMGSDYTTRCSVNDDMIVIA